MVPFVRIGRGAIMLLLLLPLPRVYVCFGVLLMLALSMDARADAVLVRFLPPGGTVAGYKVYSAFETTGAITSAPIDAGARPPDATGVASYSLANLDPTRSYSVEMTAYNSSGVESARSNRITLAARTAPPPGETLGAPLWQNDFSAYAPGVHVPLFQDLVGDVRSLSSTNLFAVSYFADGNAAWGVSGSAGALATRYVGSNSAGWGSYEISGRTWSSSALGQLGIASRSTESGGTRYFELGQNASRAWLLRTRNEPALTCARGPATGVTQPGARWYSFKLRTTRANGLTRLRAKVWSTGTTEPSAWQADCWTTVAANADSGSFSLQRSGSGSAFFDDLAVRPVQGTLDPIPGP
jgi:trimeric autotransporter adhesin